MELDSDLALELWDIFAASINPKEKSIVAESYVNWLIDNNLTDEDLEEVARQDSHLAHAISLILEDGADSEVEDYEE